MLVQVNRQMIVVRTLGYNDDDQAALRRAENCDLIEYRRWPSKKKKQLVRYRTVRYGIKYFRLARGWRPKEGPWDFSLA